MFLELNLFCYILLGSIVLPTWTLTPIYCADIVPFENYPKSTSFILVYKGMETIVY